MAFGLGLSHYGFGATLWEPSRRNYITDSLNRICFGSCNDQDLSQEFWVNIAQTNPDLWIWLGDNIYADFASPDERQLEYLALQSNRYYEDFAKSFPVVGIWDDHDFAFNNSDGTYEHKDRSQEAFCDFLRLPMQHSLRNSQGIYQSYVYGGNTKRVHLILLDMRFFKEGNSLLGEEQWQWLTREIISSPGDLILLASSLAVLSEYSGFGLEGWAGYQSERNRLFELLEQCSQPVVLLSGDRHYSELSRKTLRNGKPLYEFMASGLTHNTPVGLPNRYRIAGRAGENNFGQLDFTWQDERIFVGFRALSANKGIKLYSYGTYLNLSF